MSKGIDGPFGRGRARLRRKLFLSFALLMGLCLVLEAGASLVLAGRRAGRTGELAEESHCEYDPTLGWVNRKNVRVPDLYGPGRTLTTNARGFRGREDYTSEAPSGRYRIVCLGDSFTLGYGVDDGESFPALLEALEPALQAVNMGQGGYGIDQSYLWYLRDGLALESALVVLAFIAPDFERMLEDRFQGEYPKPVLRIEEGKLVLPEAPLPRDWELGRRARRVRRFFGELALVELARGLARGGAGAGEPRGAELPCRQLGELVLASLAETARGRGRGLVLVHLPLRDPGAGNPARLLAWLRPWARSHEVLLIDMAPEFAGLSAAEREGCYLPDGHLSARGNRLVAERLLGELLAGVPGFLSDV